MEESERKTFFIEIAKRLHKSNINNSRSFQINSVPKSLLIFHCFMNSNWYFNIAFPEIKRAEWGGFIWTVLTLHRPFLDEFQFDEMLNYYWYQINGSFFSIMFVSQLAIKNELNVVEIIALSIDCCCCCSFFQWFYSVLIINRFESINEPILFVFHKIFTWQIVIGHLPIILLFDESTYTRVLFILVFNAILKLYQ